MALYDDYQTAIRNFLTAYEAGRNQTEAQLRARIAELETTTPPVTPPVTPPADTVASAPVVTQWDGGSAYWDKFPKAKAAGWSNPSFFPISVFLSKASPEHVAKFKDAGINTYMAVEHDGSPITNITSQGMFAMLQDEWTPAEAGNHTNVVGWFASDECEMGYAGCGDDSATQIATQRRYVKAIRDRNDGRFTWANFGNGILRTFWSTSTMNDHVRLMDGSSADKYTYTSPHVQGLIDGFHEAPDWPRKAPVARAYSYGWQVDQMKRFQDPARITPTWAFIETAKPYLNETGATSITPDQIEGAVWSSLIHGARGVSYFQHNNDGRGNYSIVQIPAVHAKVKAINAKVRSLAEVLNSPSRYNTTRTVNGFGYQEWTFGNGTDTMLKVHGGYVYIFAGLGFGHSTGQKTFTLPKGATGTVEVVGENRTITPSNGSFRDTFAAEYTHHVYKIKLS